MKGRTETNMRNMEYDALSVITTVGSNCFGISDMSHRSQHWVLCPDPLHWLLRVPDSHALLYEEGGLEILL